MAPLEIMNSSTNLNNDEAFLTLLSSQRELLSRLNRESAMRRGQQQTNTVPHAASAGKQGSIIGTADPLSLMNTPIMERRGSLDMLFSRRLSMGMGNMGIGGMGMGSMGYDNFGFMHAASNDFEEGKSKEMDFPDPRKLKRRRSSLGLLNSMLFEDQSQQQQQQRRLSMLSNFSGPPGYNESFDQDVMPFETPVATSRSVRLDPTIPPEKVRSNLEAFALSMGNSTKSQQDIHDWDRKMGLKRSHSKTMRMTMRSRKKLRSMLKKDINALSQK